MTFTTPNQNLRALAESRALATTMPASRPTYPAEHADRIPPKLHPGAAITFAIAAAVAMLIFVEIVFA
jgi:hypothetical protein